MPGLVMIGPVVWAVGELYTQKHTHTHTHERYYFIYIDTYINIFPSCHAQGFENQKQDGVDHI